MARCLYVPRHHHKEKQLIKNLAFDVKLNTISMETKDNFVVSPGQDGEKITQSEEQMSPNCASGTSVQLVTDDAKQSLKRVGSNNTEEQCTAVKRECIHNSVIKSERKVKDILPIEKSVDLSVPQLPPWERYFTKRIVGDICLLIHSNRIAVVTLLPTHPVIANSKSVVSVDFAKRADNSVRGKGKRGAQALNVDSALCELLCSDDTKYIIRACIGGKLIEVNFRLMKQPQLLTKRPQAEGYIAIMLPYEPRKQKEKPVCETLIDAEVD
ncbi:protein Abitram isoform X3 [Schistocerca serialis cubense]|uniref:protein Abitram isoform X3 n=1 Tax=Schistocerca serialis cubense TaxID=2023355 RepID=UPI00214ECE00|nr:protein Abitram isoform X3 [Schistocerca serialis cubense]